MVIIITFTIHFWCAYFFTFQIVAEFIASLRMLVHVHNKSSWQEGRAQHGSCSSLYVIIMISADCWLLWCLHLSSIQPMLCVWAVLIVLMLTPPPNGGEARTHKRRGRTTPDIMNTRQSRPSVHRREEKKKHQVARRVKSAANLLSSPKKELQFPLPLIPTLKHTERGMFGKKIHQHLILRVCEWQHGDLVIFFSFFFTDQTPNGIFYPLLVFNQR